MSEGLKRECSIVAALAGSPNVGKTSLFNTLTGRAEKVANWPGVTVELKTAVVRMDGTRVCLVDLPGTYGLSGAGGEEKVARDFLIYEKPDVVVALADSTNLEKTLYLPIEIAEYTGAMVLALTKIDAAEARGIRIDVDGLARELGVRVVATSALKKRGLDELREAILEVAKKPGKPLRVDYGALEPYIERLEELIASECRGLRNGAARWLAVRLLEGLEWTPSVVRGLCGAAAERVLSEAERLRREYREATGRDPGQDAVAARYRLVERLVSRHVVRKASVEAQVSRLDAILLRPVVGPLASLAILLGIFMLIFTLNTGFPLNLILDSLGLHNAAALLEEYSIAGLMGMLFDSLAEVARNSLQPEWLASLIADGVIGGVGLVLSFVPLIALIYAVFGALEDTGIAPRIAVSFDALMRKFGIGGKAVFPAIMGLGCNVPAVAAARIMDTRRERLAVALAVPMVPCQARLVVILAFTAAFFAGLGPAAAAAAALGIYVIAYAAFLFTAWLVSRLVGGEEEEEEYFIELPPLQAPSARVVWWHVRSAVEHFLVRAGTVILVLSIVTWVLTSYTPSLTPAEDPASSIAAALGKLLAPLAEVTFGVGSEVAWRLGFAFIQGLIAKEVFLDALAMTAPGGIAGTPEEAVTYLGLTPAQAFAVLVAVTLYMPCIATLATIYAETRSAKMTLGILVYSITLATVAALAARLILESLGL